MNWATRTRNKVHKITPVIEGIIAIPIAVIAEQWRRCWGAHRSR